MTMPQQRIRVETVADGEVLAWVDVTAPLGLSDAEAVWWAEIEVARKSIPGFDYVVRILNWPEK